MPPTETIIQYLAIYSTGVAIIAAGLWRSPTFRHKEEEMAIASYLWPLLVAILVASIPYEVGKTIGKKLRR